MSLVTITTNAGKIVSATGMDGTVYLIGERWVYEEDYLPFVGKWRVILPRFKAEYSETWNSISILEENKWRQL